VLIGLTRISPIWATVGGNGRDLRLSPRSHSAMDESFSSGAEAYRYFVNADGSLRLRVHHRLPQAKQETSHSLPRPKIETSSTVLPHRAHACGGAWVSCVCKEYIYNSDSSRVLFHGQV
jgi:hypothetical protein